MDLTLQRKLTKMEWNMLEIPVSDDEKKILQVIIDGYTNVHIHYNNNETMMSFIKNTFSLDMEKTLYKNYFDKPIKDIIKKYIIQNQNPNKEFDIFLEKINNEVNNNSNIKLKRADSIRIENMTENINSNKEKIFEFIQIEFAKKILKYISIKNKKYAFYLYTLIQTNKAKLINKNSFVQLFINCIIEYALNNDKHIFRYIIENAQENIEKNKHIIEYSDMVLYEHQRKLFSLFHNINSPPRLVLYLAPTGTGKTMSPLGLSNQYRIIFVCVARHVGLALAKSAISMGKKIAFGFGCESASDIRLHYFSAKEYTKNYRSGMIYKVDNSIGNLVEIMICDIKSYLCAMNYMTAFNPVENIITYWDEPTITMDVENHELHSIIQKNWCENRIPNLILSCATLPNEEDIMDTINDFRIRFSGAEIHTISSYETKKTVSIVNKDSYTVTPHNLYKNYNEILNCVKHCNKTKSLLKYFDLEEISKFIIYVNDQKYIKQDRYYINEYFSSITDITMSSIKIYYLELLKNIKPDLWEHIYLHLLNSRVKKINSNSILKRISSTSNIPENNKKTVITNSSTIANKSGGGEITRTYSVMSSIPLHTGNTGNILVTTEDAHTLTDGPTIYLADDINKIARFYLQQSNIPEMLLNRISASIDYNNKINKQINKLQKTIEDYMSKDSEKENKMSQEHRIPENVRNLIRDVNDLKKKIQTISLDKEYVPNSFNHLKKWTGTVIPNAFTCDIEEEIVEEIMNLQGIENSWKLLLLMGIGVFSNSTEEEQKQNIDYIEIMKKLAYSQKLYIIIASSDFIYGTNYQFTHAFIGKDLIGLTQQKIIQSIGRVGRNNVQQNYTVRFRDNEMLEQLFQKSDNNMEAQNMSRLFNSVEGQAPQLHLFNSV